MKKLKTFTTTIGLILIFAMFFSAAKYFTFDTRYYFQQQIEIYLQNKVPLYLHIIGATAALILGPFQFWTDFRNKHLRWHKIMGRIYMLGIILGGFSGIYLSSISYGGWPTHLGFWLLSVLWLITAYLAYKTIRAKKVQEHKKWMIRNYSLTLAAISLRIWLIIFILLGFSFVVSYTWATWLSWTLNLIAAEILISKKV